MFYQNLSSEKIVVAIVYFSLFLDNVLLTVVVPIIPDYLFRVETQYRNSIYPNVTKVITSYEEVIGSENGRIGILLSSKAFVQILINPFFGYAARYTGYTIPLFFGTINLLVSCLLFAFGEGYAALFFARSLQGIASACIGVAGMSLVAEYYPDEKVRSKVMGIVLGSVALGVLVGYPVGGLLYDFIDKDAPFLMIAALATLDIGIQLSFLNLKVNKEDVPPSTGWSGLLSDGLIMLTAAAIWLSSSAMAILEPCLPLWLISQIKPEKWQLGTVFIPDSVGYLIGTNCFGVLAYKLGRWRVAIAAMVTVGLSTAMLPAARTMWALTVPHFLLGLGIGVVDAALVPMLATLVDSRHHAHYGAVYAIQQTAVCLAYALGPMIGGEIVNMIGFPWLMRCVGIINIIYAPLLTILAKFNKEESTLIADSHIVDYKSNKIEPSIKNYQRFNDSDESD